MKNKMIEIQVELTTECHLKCIHCSSPNNNSQINKNIKEIFSACSNSNANFSISFTGGEPLSYLVEQNTPFCYSDNIKYYALFTSGIVYKNCCLSPISDILADSFYDSGVRLSYISLYSHDKRIHDAITSVENSWNTTVNSIHNLIKNKIKVIIHYVPTKLNFDFFEKDILFFQELGVSKIRILTLVDTGRAQINIDKLKIDIPDSQLLYLKNKYKIISLSGKPLLSPCRPFHTHLGCCAGSDLLYIDINGNIYPCASVKNNANFKICNIKEVVSFDDIICNTKYQNCLIQQ